MSKTLYSGKIAQSFGLLLFPTLATQNPFVEGDDLPRLYQAAQIILQNARLFAQHAELHTSYVVFRVENILRATEQAIQAKGGIVIW